MYIYATIDSDTDPFILIDYRHSGYDGDLCYINNLLEENIPINLLQVHVNEERHYLPHLIVVHPDYLIDISSLAACFRCPAAWCRDCVFMPGGDVRHLCR